ncbi:MAG: ribbon-helix-helix domain-containing protein [Geminicoccaceae bacterium]|nr:ribbon-helix-helix domain-containing protein [Geminicoccaceae bacterium]MCS7268723.1 ribbon-helix-helix domain-containing protein [Geminicoccaceae bacterium]MCX7629089.1 ribbon-helix-helix domain-containing protein [Geminicoccaceae bacterium]MDW8125799.1 ribbon-helix-helix domain-containing protein [Geminicoccaceae bacterium]MDW8342611.1 ribbon-helix-helix domain-containing protein [Geminicoccaceae bacterium]
MCRIYAGTDPRDYEPVTRSMRLHGAVTSIRLEARFWAILDEMAAAEGMSTPKFVATLYDEVVELAGEVRNFASLLRVACATYLARERATKRSAEAAAQRAEAA